MTAQRISVQPTYDSSETGPRYHVTTTVAGRTIEFQKRIQDPFVMQRLIIGWPDLLRGLIRRRLVVEVLVGGDLDVVNDVMELDADHLVPGSTRHAEFHAGINDAIARAGT